MVHEINGWKYLHHKCQVSFASSSMYLLVSFLKKVFLSKTDKGGDCGVLNCQYLRL